MHIWQYYVSMPRVLATILLRGTIPVNEYYMCYYFEWRERERDWQYREGVRYCMIIFVK